jgi:uncharacterized protein YciI
MLYSVRCVDRVDADALRARHVVEHKQYLRDQAHILVLGGALLGESERDPIGSLYIVNVADRQTAEQFSKGDPFTREGVFQNVVITPMRKSHFNPQAAAQD